MILEKKNVLSLERIFLPPFAFLVFFFLTPYFIYSYFGPAFVQTLYEGKTFGFLNQIISAQKTYPLSYYLMIADQRFNSWIGLMGVTSAVAFLAATIIYFLIKANRLNIALLLSSTLLTLFFSEMMVRVFFYPPRRVDMLSRLEPKIHTEDPLVGWKRVAGVYTVPPYSKEGGHIKITVWPSGMRATGEDSNPIPERRILACGNSFVFGWALSDQETFLYKLQLKFKDIEFLNMGTGGYSTYQCFLSLQRYLQDTHQPPSAIFYFLTEFDPLRNVGDRSWLRGLMDFPQRNHVRAPYCLINREGELTPLPPEAYPIWPGDQYFSLVNLLKDTYVKFKTANRRPQAVDVTKKILFEMKKLCARYQTVLYVVVLQMEPESKDVYKKFLEEIKIASFDCDRPEFSLAEMKVLGEGHPNGRMNSIWADCIEKEIQRNPAL